MRFASQALQDVVDALESNGLGMLAERAEGIADELADEIAKEDLAIEEEAA